MNEMAVNSTLGKQIREMLDCDGVSVKLTSKDGKLYLLYQTYHCFAYSAEWVGENLEELVEVLDVYPEGNVQESEA
jgi:hypothetical protein